MSKIDATLVAFAKDNPEAFETIPGFETAREITTLLFNEGLGASGLIHRIAYHESRNRLLVHLHNLFRSGHVPIEYRVKLGHLPTIEDFYKAMLALNDDHIREMGFSDNVIGAVTINETCACVAFQHTTIFDDFDHWAWDDLVKLVPQDIIDIAWSNQVRRFLSRRQWRRAFDEVKRARHGFIVPLDNLDYPEYRHPASRDKVKQLVKEVYENMVAASELSPITEADCTIRSVEAPTTRYSLKGDKHKIHADTISRTLPGLKLAKMFTRQQGQGVKRKGSSWDFESPLILEPEGAMALKIAGHFNKARNERRRVKYEKFLTDYNTTHK